MLFVLCTAARAMTCAGMLSASSPSLALVLFVEVMALSGECPRGGGDDDEAKVDRAATLASAAIATLLRLERVRFLG